MPTQCPECGSGIVRPEGEAVTRCLNASCPAIVKGAIAHWASRDAMDIDGLGEKIVAQLADSGLVRSVADLYGLRAATLIDLERLGQKSAENLVAAIAHSKQQPWWRVLYALGIRFVGSVNARTLTAAFPSVEQLQTASIDDLAAVYGIGTEIARSVVQWFAIPANRHLVERLRNAGVQFAGAPPVQTQQTGAIAGRSFVITGTLPTLKRDEAKALIEAAGGKVTGSVSTKTDYLVAGEKAGSKRTKAEQLAISILSEDDLRALLAESEA